MVQGDRSKTQLNRRIRSGAKLAFSCLVPTPKSQSLTLSVVLHAAGLIVLLALNSRVFLSPAIPANSIRSSKLVFIPPLENRAVGRRAGGANSAETPTRKGVPPFRAQRYFIPPETRSEPKLPMQFSSDFDPPSTVLAASLVGDPYGKLGGSSLGAGGTGGIGSFGCCGGVGDQQGGRDMSGSGGHPLIPPKLIYKVEPEFSEEARKAKFQGTVILTADVDASGKATHLTVISSPGLGLDLKALEAVAQWRFRPAYRDGKPITTTARIEVGFHLL